MVLRAWCAAGLLTTVAAAAQEAPHSGEWIVHEAIEASATALNFGSAPAPVVRWDGQAISEEEEVRGLKDSSRRSIETWRQFAQKRGYRVDLDESQRVMVISNAERFASFATSERIIEKVLDRIDSELETRDIGPLVVLRAASSADAEDAINGSMLLDVNHRLDVFEETGDRKDVRAVDARLAEALVRVHLTDQQPFLSEWMSDGLSSLVAAEVTGRAIVDGKAVSLRAVRNSVAKSHKRDTRDTVDLLAISGAGSSNNLLEAEAMAVLSFLDVDELRTLVPELGQRDLDRADGKYRQEEDALQSHLGPTALQDLQRSLKRGK